MERIIKIIKKYQIFPLIITLILFMIPFFWFKPGEMDLGGDSSRLYFYNPWAYLTSYPLYGLAPSNFGYENIGYYALPFIFLLIGLKQIFYSPTILIEIFHGFSLASGFIFTYLSIQGLLGYRKLDTKFREIGAIVGGLFYTLSPITIEGWDKVILTHNQFFLNPLIFFLLLRFLITSRISYLFLTLIITFIFSPNFTYGAAPPIFSFYPLAITFLLIHRKFILKQPLPILKILLCFLLFISLQLFHIVPYLQTFLTPGLPGSATYDSVFSNVAKFDRGLSYFLGIAPDIKVSLNFFTLPQMENLGLDAILFFVFPSCIILGFIYNKKNKVMLLTAIFFLITLFFVSAHITNIGFSFYEWLFNVPGFSMFRNFNGQFMYVFLFFYSLLLGQALNIIFNKIKKVYAYMIILCLFLVLILHAVPFITGVLVNKTLWTSNNKKIFMTMDPQYEKMLSYIRSLPSDGKVLTLPLTDPGYQIVAGTNNGAYEGPSTIAYLTEKKDFSGFGEFGDFDVYFLHLVQNKDYEKIKKLFAIFGIKYIFYNSDPNVYDSAFPSFPYSQIRDYLPKDQRSYPAFINALGFHEKKMIGEYYHIYEPPADDYIPTISTPQINSNYDISFKDLDIPLSFSDPITTSALYNDPHLIDANFITENNVSAKEKSVFADVLVPVRNSQLPSPFVSQKPGSLFYLYTVWKEKNTLKKQNPFTDFSIDLYLQYMSKRINELQRWGDEIPILGNVKSINALDNNWQEPSWKDWENRSEYDSWEITLVRYQRLLKTLLQDISIPNQSAYSDATNKVYIEKSILDQKQQMLSLIDQSTKSENDKRYLKGLVQNMYADILPYFTINYPDPTAVQYTISVPQKGEYIPFAEKNALKNFDPSNLTLKNQNTALILASSQSSKNWLQFDTINLNKGNYTFTLAVNHLVNIAEESPWQMIEQTPGSSQSADFVINNATFSNPSGIIKPIPSWNPLSHYLISFDYLTNGKNFAFNIQEQDDKNHINSTVSDTLSATGWKTYKKVVAASENAQSAFLQIVKSQDTSADIIGDQTFTASIQIKNLAIISLPSSNIIFKQQKKSENNDNPKITFQKINPTAYKINVSHAMTPYVLTFLNAYNRNWKIYILHNDLILPKDISYKYNNGNISEAIPENIFADKETLSTFGKKDIAANTHYQVDGYANAWVINPTDVNNKQNYTLLLSLSTQKTFYISFVISLVTFIVCVVMLLYTILKK